MSYGVSRSTREVAILAVPDLDLVTTVTPALAEELPCPQLSLVLHWKPMRHTFFFRYQYVRMAVLVRRIGCKVCERARYAPHNRVSLLRWHEVVLVALTLRVVIV